MPSGKRLWRTADGSLVEDGHPDAVFLAYGPDDALNPGDERVTEPKAKRARKPADKQVTKPADK